MMPFAVTGTIAWAVAGVLLLVLPSSVAPADRTGWLWTCLAGVIAGVVGCVTMWLRAKRRLRQPPVATENRESDATPSR